MDNEVPKVIGNYFTSFITKNYSFSQFKKFIFSLLEKYIFDTENEIQFLDKFLTEKNLSFLQKAFVHQSFDIDINYQNLEKFGDKILKITITNYIIFNRFANITVPETYSNLYHNLTDKTSFSQFGKLLGFRDYFIFSAEIEEKTSGIKNVDSNAILKQTLEDTFEAFFGALFYLFEIIEGFDFALNKLKKFIFAFLNTQKISLEGDIKNIMMQINEIYPQLGWGQMNQYKVSRKDPNDKFKFWTTFYGFAPEDSKKENKIVLSKGYGRNINDSELAAAKQLLYVFRTKYKIQVKRIDFYEKINRFQEIESPFSREELNDFLKSFLINDCQFLDSYADSLISDINIMRLKTTFTQGFYTTKINYTKYIYFGERIIEFLNNYMITKKYFIYTEGIISTIGTYYTSLFKNNDIFNDFVSENTFDEPRNKVFKYMKEKNINFYAFICSVFDIISSSLDFATSILTINNFVNELLENSEIYISYQKIIDPVTRTKEIYDKWEVDFSKYFIYEILENGSFKVKLSTPEIFNKKAVSVETIGTDKTNAYKKASQLMLDVLNYKYGFKENYTDPFLTGEKWKIIKNRQKI